MAQVDHAAKSLFTRKECVERVGFGRLDCQPLYMTPYFPQQYEGVGLFKRVRDRIS